MNDEQRKAMFAKMNVKGSGIRFSQLHPLIETKNNPDKKIVTVVDNLIKNENTDLLKNVDSIIIEKTENPVRPHAIAYFNPREKELRIIDRKSAPKENLKYTLRHELEHAWFNEEIKKHPKKIEAYKKKIVSIPPPTINMEMYQNNLKMWDSFKNDYNKMLSDKENKIVDDIIDFLKDEYVDEMHSETGEIIEYQKDGVMEPYFVANPSFKRAIRYYRELHS